MSLFIISTLFAFACAPAPTGTAEVQPERPNPPNDHQDRDESEEIPEESNGHGSENDPAHEDEPPPSEEEETEPEDHRFWPLESGWSMADVYLSHDGCNMGDQIIIDVAPTVSLSVDDDRNMVLNHHFGTDNCELDDEGSDFNCDSRIMYDHTPSERFGLDAVIVLDVEPTGEFLADDYLRVEANLTATCEGSN